MLSLLHWRRTRMSGESHGGPPRYRKDSPVGPGQFPNATAVSRGMDQFPISPKTWWSWRFALAHGISPWLWAKFQSRDTRFPFPYLLPRTLVTCNPRRPSLVVRIQRHHASPDRHLRSTAFGRWSLISGRWNLFSHPMDLPLETQFAIIRQFLKKDREANRIL